AELVLRVDAVTGGADAHLARLEGQPVALAHHRGAGAVGELPAHGAPRRNECGDGAVGRYLRGALRTREHAAARARRGRAAQAAELFGLEELEVRDVE